MRCSVSVTVCSGLCNAVQLSIISNGHVIFINLVTIQSCM